MRRILSWVLLASVVLALGDAPYVDELFDALSPGDLTAAGAAHDIDRAQKPLPTIDHSSRAIRIYQALATIFTAPATVALAAALDTCGYNATPSRIHPSVDPSRIDRPPAPLTA